MTRTFALFRVAAGRRIGHGHLRRAEALAAALGRAAQVSIRGGGASTSLARVAVEGTAALDAVAPAVLVLDDPHVRHATTWCRAATRRGIPVVSLHDLGIARVPSALAVDGSVVSPAQGWPSEQVQRGLAHAVIRPPRRRRRVTRRTRILVSLGGGPRMQLTRSIAAAIARRLPDAEVVVASRATAAAAAAGSTGRVRAMAAPHGLAPLLASVDLAVLGGGVSLYEAVAAGVPAVGVAVVSAQKPTIRGFVRKQVVRDGGSASSGIRVLARRLASQVAAAIADRAWRRDVARRGPRLVDGGGARRVATAIVRVAEAARV